MLCQFCVFLGFWLLVSGSFDWQHLVLGSIASLFLTVFWRDENEKIVNHISLRKIWRGIQTVGFLIYEVWSAACAVARIVFSRKMPIEPTLVHTSTKLNSNRMRMLYANSITLTPGTLTLQLDENRLLVHSLTKDAAAGVANWDFENNLIRLEEAD